MTEPMGTERVLYEDDDGNTVGDVYQLGSQTLRPGVEFTTRAGVRYSFVKVSYGPNGGGDSAILLGLNCEGNVGQLMPSLPAQVKTIHRTTELAAPPSDQVEPPSREELADTARYHSSYNHARGEALQALRDNHADEYKGLLDDARRKHNAYRSHDPRFNHDRT